MKYHIVKQGEDMVSIASAYKIGDWQGLYDHQANERLKSLREDPNCLKEGDIVYIPETEPNVISASTNQLHNLQITVIKRKLIMNLKDIEQEPLKNCKYELKIGSNNIQGQTDGSGKLEEEISGNAQKGMLRIWHDPEDPGSFREMEILLGHLDPSDEISGLQGRLMNLGYYDNMLDDDFGDKTKSAILNFQQDHDLPLSGKFDSATKSKIDEIYQA